MSDIEKTEHDRDGERTLRITCLHEAATLARQSGSYSADEVVKEAEKLYQWATGSK